MDKSQLSDPNATYTIQQVSVRLGLSVHTLRYYERIGLLESPARDFGGRRQYATQDVARIALLILMRETGMPLFQIKGFTSLLQQGNERAAERRQILQDHRDHVQKQIEKLSENLSMIDMKLELLRSGQTDPEAQAKWQASCLQKLENSLFGQIVSPPLIQVSKAGRSAITKQTNTTADEN